MAAHAYLSGGRTARTIATPIAWLTALCVVAAIVAARQGEARGIGYYPWLPLRHFAFGLAVLLDERCCDPFYRKAIRVSVGAVLRTPFAVGGSAGDLVRRLIARGFEVLALTPSASETLAAYRRGGPVAIVLGSEGPGLPTDVIARCRAVGVPMHGGLDSLNVAATSAIALHHLTSAALSGPGRSCG